MEEYEIVKCKICGNWYQHPKDCQAGWGKCQDCFWTFVSAELENIRVSRPEEKDDNRTD